MQDKHDQKRKIKKQICDIKFQLKSSLTLILYNILLHQIYLAVKSRVKAITTRHLNKLRSLCNKISTYSKNVNRTSFIKSTVYYTLTEGEYIALAFVPDHHIPARTNKNIIDTEFELYFQRINRYVQASSQKLKKVPQVFTDVFNVYDITASDVMRRNQHHK